MLYFHLITVYGRWARCLSIRMHGRRVSSCLCSVLFFIFVLFCCLVDKNSRVIRYGYHVSMGFTLCRVGHSVSTPTAKRSNHVSHLMPTLCTMPGSVCISTPLLRILHDNLKAVVYTLISIVLHDNLLFIRSLQVKLLRRIMYCVLHDNIKRII